MSELPVRVLTFAGPLPCKKNRPMGRRFSIDPVMKADINAITTAMKEQWRDPATFAPYATRKLAALRFDIDYLNGGADADGIVTTVLDCLKSAGVITEDNMANLQDTRTTARPHDGPLPVLMVTVSGGVEVERRGSKWVPIGTKARVLHGNDSRGRYARRMAAGSEDK